MSKASAVVAWAKLSLGALALLGAGGCAVDAQDADSASAEGVGAEQQAVVNPGIAQAFRNVSTQRCLDGNAAGKVYTSGCYWATFQSWRPVKFASVDPGFQLINTQTNRCLDSNTGGSVYTLPCNGGRFQQWEFDAHSPTRLKNSATGRMLDSNTAGSVYTLPNNNGNFQRWQQFCLNGALCLDLNL